MKNSSREKQEKGITLIALVITIIVLLILAGVSIAMLTGQNGILTQAQNASKQTDIGEEKEQIALAYNGAVTEKQSTDITAKDLNDQFKANGVNNATASGENPITVTFDSGRTYTIDENGSISEPTESNIVATMRIEGERVETPPMPETNDSSNVFTHVEGTVDDGYVIEDSNGNQFVWVPVDKNQKLKINVTSKEDIESITLKDPYGDTILTESNVGTSYSKEDVEPTINGPYVLNVKTTTESKTTMLGVHSLYAVDTMRDWESTMSEEEIDEQIKQMEEVASQQGYSSVEEYANAMLQQEGLPTLEEMGFSTFKEYILASQMFNPGMKDYSETEYYSELVNSNGGFYIGRYEASYENGKAASKESTVANTNISSTLENGKLWNNISQADALSYSNKMYEGETFTSSLLTGAAWDRTLGWLEETGVVTSYEIVEDSKTWGNYRDDTFSGDNGIANTGVYSQTEKNHIFDLAGNLAEWTTEVYSTDSRVFRGGNCIVPGSSTPSNRNGYSSGGDAVNVGFRVALYVK